MRSARVELGSGGGSSGKTRYSRPFLVRSASNFPAPRTPEDYRNPDPRREVRKRVNKKTPLLQPANDPIASIKLNANIGSRKHAVSNCPLPSRLPVAAEGRLHSYFANSYQRRATAQPTFVTRNAMI